MTVLRRQWNTLHKSDTQAAGMLLNTVAGGNGVRARKHAAHLVESALCARCGQHDETEAHRFWECEHINTIDLPPVPPAARARGDAETCPALWIRCLADPEDTLPRPTSSLPAMASTLWFPSGTPREAVMHLTHVTVGWAQLRSFGISQAPCVV